MKTYVLTEGGRGIGFGHIARCSALYDAFTAEGPAPILVINGDDSIKGMLVGKKYISSDWIKDKNILSKVLNKDNIVIVDSYLAPRSFYERVSEMVKTPVFLDDNKRMDYPRGIVINGAVYAERMGYPGRKGSMYLLGTKFMLLRKEFQGISRKQVSKEIKKIMLIFGGDDTRNMVPTILRHIDMGRFFTKVVIGRAFGNIKEIERFKSNRIELIYYPDAKILKNVMQESDLAISAGGQTLYELASIGLPTIAIGVVKNQIDNINGWIDAGFIEYAGWWNLPGTLKKLKALLNKMRDRTLRQAHSDAGRMCIDGEGAARVVKEIYAYCNA